MLEKIEKKLAENKPIKLDISMVRGDEIYLRDELTKRGKLAVISEINDDYYKDFRQDLLWCITCGDLEEIEIEICSPGGSVFHGFAIYDLIRKCQMEYDHIPINTIGNGYMASIGSIIFQAGKRRKALRNSWMLIHEISTLTFGDEKTSFIEDEHKLLQRLQKNIVELYIERSNLTKKKIEFQWVRKNWWISSKEMLELGLCDEVINTSWKNEKK